MQIDGIFDYEATHYCTIRSSIPFCSLLWGDNTCFLTSSLKPTLWKALFALIRCIPHA